MGCLQQTQGPRQERQSWTTAPRRPNPLRRNFTADGPNRLWLTDITEHATGESKLYLGAVKDACSGHIVGYSINARMKSRLVVGVLESAVALLRDASCTPTPDRNSAPARSPPSSPGTAWPAPWAGLGPPATTPQWRASSHCCRRMSLTAAPGPPARSRGSRSSPGSSGPATGADGNDAWVACPPGQVRDHRDPTRSSGCIDSAVT
ncbi:DDE-type integrase/transposase/recombinase [Streptomyces sp. NPDC057644]|uniref:DDE-type integrase/transposase/recombinase n=1 Tax=Streptomyces sp. NPDC057644 TaxID=3346191 RepID=UPI003687E67D